MYLSNHREYLWSGLETRITGNISYNWYLHILSISLLTHHAILPTPLANKQMPYTQRVLCYHTRIFVNENRRLHNVLIMYESRLSYFILWIKEEHLKRLLKLWSRIGSPTNGTFRWFVADNTEHSVTGWPNAELFSELRAFPLPRPWWLVN